MVSINSVRFNLGCRQQLGDLLVDLTDRTRVGAGIEVIASTNVSVKRKSWMVFFCGARDRRRAFHRIGLAHCPFVALLRAHRPADYQRQIVTAKFFGDRLVLRAYVVADPHMCEIQHSGRQRRVVRRGRETAADLVDDDNEILGGVERAAPPIKTCSMILFAPEYQVGTRIALSLAPLNMPKLP